MQRYKDVDGEWASNTVSGFKEEVGKGDASTWSAVVLALSFIMSGVALGFGIAGFAAGQNAGAVVQNNTRHTDQNTLDVKYLMQREVLSTLHSFERGRCMIPPSARKIFNFVHSSSAFKGCLRQFLFGAPTYAEKGCLPLALPDFGMSIIRSVRPDFDTSITRSHYDLGGFYATMEPYTLQTLVQAMVLPSSRVEGGSGFFTTNAWSTVIPSSLQDGTNELQVLMYMSSNVLESTPIYYWFRLRGAPEADPSAYYVFQIAYRVVCDPLAGAMTLELRSTMIKQGDDENAIEDPDYVNPVPWVVSYTVPMP